MGVMHWFIHSAIQAGHRAMKCATPSVQAQPTGTARPVVDVDPLLRVHVCLSCFQGLIATFLNVFLERDVMCGTRNRADRKGSHSFMGCPQIPC